MADEGRDLANAAAAASAASAAAPGLSTTSTHMGGTNAMRSARARASTHPPTQINLTSFQDVSKYYILREV